VNLTGSKSKRRLAEVIGHELRNPLASAVARISVSMEMTERADPRSRLLDKALDDLSRVSTLLTRYLQFGRSGDLECKDLDLADLVRSVGARFEHAASRMQVEAAEEPVHFCGDRALLERMVENILENAIAVGARNVDVLITVEKGNCVLCFTDDGPGVPHHLTETLFDPFVSGRGSSGIGLALARDVAESHGGTVTLAPSEVGAVFRVTLPV
jgi:signal transduction histidine kinase